MSHRRPTRRQLLVGAAAASVLFPAPAIARSVRPVTRIGGLAFGTRWNLTIRLGADAELLAAVVSDIVEHVDRLMSPWRADSVISDFNRRQDTGWMQVGNEITRVMNSGQAVHHRSGGAFDVAVGPLVARYGFGPIQAVPPPTEAAFSVSEDALAKSHPSLTADLCGVAKGYALDQIVDAISRLGEKDFVLDLGGEISTRGLHPDGRGWQVAVEDPRPFTAGAAEIVALADMSIATSGDRLNAYVIGNRRFSHVIDPLKAAPVDGATASVSVIAASGMVADAWATALMAAGADGPTVAERNGIDALFLLREGERLRRVSVSRFDQHLA